ncbi:hypothetical protein QFC21_001172 [Naganishia friedmannii]|uniref:Uncharacterized protein n=1 Tax=Naganishia friedmannii TaxID=89922 RepID=A0ACC2W9E8_9TREE|nr:hypothetical protein QFC21_001172 [Naganishia friedmannii]
MNTTVDQAAVGDKAAHKDPLYAQQAATSPMGGGAVADPNVAPLPKLPFKEQVKGYAKLTAGTLTGNQKEKDLGQAKLDGHLEDD